MEKDNKPVMGRPKSEDPSSKKLPMVRVTEDQLNNYRKSSKREGKTFSGWVRDCLDKASE